MKQNDLIKYMVLDRLMTHQELRDSMDAMINEIMSECWSRIYPELDYKFAYYETVVALQAAGRLPKQRSIERYYRHWQKVRPDLRGKEYGKRKKQEIEVREEYAIRH